MVLDTIADRLEHIAKPDAAAVQIALSRAFVADLVTALREVVTRLDYLEGLVVARRLMRLDT